MTTAADIRKELENSMTCFGIDDWIDSYLLKEFMASGGAKVSVRVRAITVKAWGVRAFIKDMRTRGFCIMVTRPQLRSACADGYFEISL